MPVFVKSYFRRGIRVKAYTKAGIKAKLEHLSRKLARHADYKLPTTKVRLQRYNTLTKINKSLDFIRKLERRGSR